MSIPWNRRTPEKTIPKAVFLANRHLTNLAKGGVDAAAVSIRRLFLKFARWSGRS
jgi:hypothetical protein